LSEAHQWYALGLIATGQAHETFREIDRARTLEARSLTIDS
jgi:hypothetical protein